MEILNQTCHLLFRDKMMINVAIDNNVAGVFFPV